MIKKQINYRKTQTNQLLWSFFTMLLFSFSHNCYAQSYLDTNRSFMTEEDWSKAIDSMFHKGILDSTMDAWAVLRFKVDESGKVMSAHIIKSANIAPTLFYDICATIEDRYTTPFFKDVVKMYQEHLENGALYVALKRSFPKSAGHDKRHTSIPAEKKHHQITRRRKCRDNQNYNNDFNLNNHESMVR